MKPLLGILLTLAAVSVRAEVVEVELTLPLPARLDLRGHRTVAVAPFFMAREDGETVTRLRGVDVQGEFDGYLRRLVRRNTRLQVLDTGPIKFPTQNIGELARDGDFWRYLGERTQADLILAGSLDFDVRELRGYRSQPLVVHGVTYYRQELVPRTGFEFDILMLVLDGKTGALLFADNFKDFRQFEGERVDPLAGMFENLYALEGRIAGIFTSRWLRTPRALFTN